MCCAERRREETNEMEPQSDPEASIDMSLNNSESCFLKNQYRYEGFVLDHYIQYHTTNVAAFTNDKPSVFVFCKQELRKKASLCSMLTSPQGAAG